MKLAKEFPALVLLVLALRPAPGIAQESVNPPDVTQLTRAVRQAGAPRSSAACDTCGTTPTPPAPQADSASFWSSVSCKDLFSNDPPAWTDGTTALAPVNGEWFALCSLSKYAEKKRENTASTTDDVIGAVAKYQLERDHCADPTKDRFSGKFVTKTREDLKLEIMTDEQRNAQLREAKQVVRDVTNACCGTDAKCRSVLSKVSIVWCKPQEDPKKPDDCAANGTFYDDGEDESGALSAWYNSTEAEVPPGGTIPVVSGSVHVSPLINEKGLPDNSMLVFAHEFGHACSDIRRRLAAKRGQRDVATALVRYQINDDCTLSPEIESTYKRLFASFSASPDSYSCLVDVAKAAVTDRFDSNPCEGSCPASFIEESFAEWIAFHSGPADADQIFREACNTGRDRLHSLDLDDFRCMLKTPFMGTRFKKVFRCR